MSVVAGRQSNVIAIGVVAGIIGGVLIDTFLVVANHASPIQIWQFVASGLVGPAAFGSTSYAWLGLLLHFITSIAWGVTYAGLASASGFFRDRAAVGGLLFGVIVMIVMQIMLIIKHMVPLAMPPPASLLSGLVAHTVFFGLPVALFVSRALRR